MDNVYKFPAQLNSKEEQSVSKFYKNQLILYL